MIKKIQIQNLDLLQIEYLHLHDSVKDMKTEIEGEHVENAGFENALLVTRNILRDRSGKKRQEMQVIVSVGSPRWKYINRWLSNIK